MLGHHWSEMDPMFSLSLSYTHTHSVLRGISLYHMIYTYIVTMYMRKCINVYIYIYIHIKTFN